MGQRDPGHGALAGEGLDPAHAGRDGRFGNNLDQANVAGARHMRAAAQLDRKIPQPQHAHPLAVFLAEQRHGTGLLGRGEVHFLIVCRLIGTHLGVDHILDGAQFPVGQGFAMGEVEPQALGIDQRTFLCDMIAQHPAQGCM